MPDKPNRCMVCGKPFETGGSICQQCNESIRGEAAGKRKRMGSAAEKEMKKHGQKPPPK
jgi:predicted nucleic acid-binding Zn ribbon protein